MLNDGLIQRKSHEAFNDLPDADAVRPLGEQDHACLKEVRDIPERHGMMNRFGVTLLHRHFDLRKGEVLLETTDEETRVQTIAPAKIDQLEARTMLQTQFSLESGEAVLMCTTECVISNDSHRSKHVTYGG